VTAEARAALVAAGRRLVARGLSPGSSGNLSVRIDDLVLITPSGLGLGDLRPDDIAEAAAPGPRASKELPLHLAVYERRPEARAVVHLHAPSSTALSCLPPAAWPGGRLPWLTPYQVTKVGELPTVPYAVPGSAELAAAVGERASGSPCLLLANHGSIASGSSLTGAVEAAEELEAAARLLLTVLGLPYTSLSDDQAEELRRRLKP
jgi:ribulose-5-phosphate 4-epimerase/fuculose-1-phosphate aldolase